MKAKVGDEVKIFWLDIRHEDDLVIEQIQELVPAKAITRGKLLKLTDDIVTVASTEFPGSRGEPTEYRGIICLPRCVVGQIKK